MQKLTPLRRLRLTRSFPPPSCGGPPPCLPQRSQGPNKNRPQGPAGSTNPAHGRGRWHRLTQWLRLAGCPLPWLPPGPHARRAAQGRGRSASRLADPHPVELPVPLNANWGNSALPNPDWVWNSAHVPGGSIAKSVIWALAPNLHRSNRLPTREGRKGTSRHISRLPHAPFSEQLVRSAKGAARTTSRVRNCQAPHSFLREFHSRPAVTGGRRCFDLFWPVSPWDSWL